MSARPRGSLARVAITAAAAVAVIASQAIQPISASAQTLPPGAHHRPAHMADPKLAPGKPRPWSAARAKPHLTPHKTVNAAELRRQAIASAARTERTASYQISPATLRFLRVGLGMPLGAVTTFTGVRSGRSLTISLPAPERLRAGVPGVRMPVFGRSLLTIDRRTGAATLTAAAKSGPATAGSLKVAIPDAASSTLSGLSGDATLRLPVLGETVSLSGPLGYRAGAPVSLSLKGTLPARANLGHGVAALAAGDTVTAGARGGLRVAGPATLGPAGHRLGVTVAGAINGKNDWSLAVTSVTSAAPLPGLALASAGGGSVTDAHGRISYHVRGRTARPWIAAPGVRVSGTVDFSDGLPNGRLVPAPGITGTSPWADVTGTVSLASGVTSRGTVAINLASGKGLLTSAGRTAVTLRTPAGKIIRDSAGFHASLDMSRSGQVAARLPRQLSRWAPAVPAPRRPARPKAVTGATVRSVSRAAVNGQAALAAASTSYTLSGPVYDFITKTLNIPLGSATLTGTVSGSTLTLSASAPTSLPASVPSWLPSPSYVNTQITVDESADTVTLTASTGSTSGMTATLDVTIASASTSDLSNGTDVSGTLTLDGVPFAGGSTATLAFTLGYASGALTASLTGSLASAATFAGGVVTIPAGTSLTLATGSGITLSGAADLTYNSQTTEVTVDGTLTSLSNWMLTVGNASGAAWQPVTGLTVTPDFTGSITDTGGSIGFDLKSGTGTATWVSPDQAATVSVNSLEVSNQAPASGAGCAASQVTGGDLWIGVDGGFSYVPAGLDVSSATGCFDLTGKSATITTAAAGNLTRVFGSALPFTVTAAGLTAHVSAASYSLTGTASVVVTGGVSGNPQFTVGVMLTSAGITAGIGVGDLSKLGMSGSGAVFVSTVPVPDFDPAALGITGQPSSVNLPAGLSVSLDYTLPSDLESKLQQAIPALGSRQVPGLTPGTSVRALATLSAAGFTVDLGLSLGTTTNGLTIFNANNSAFYFNGLDVKLALGTQNQVTLSGTGYLVLPPLAPGTGSSGVSVTLSGSFNFNSLTLGLGFNVGNVNDAFGVSQLSAQDFGGTLGLTVESGVPTPSVDVYADNIVLPPSWASAIGVVPGSGIWFNANLSLTQPVLAFRMNNPYGGPVLTPLAIDPNASSAVVNSFVVNSASFVLAPDGGTTAAGDTLAQGVSVIFDANLASVPVHVDATVNLTAPSVKADASIGAFTIGSVQTSNTSFHLNLSPTNLSLGVTGGVSYNNDSFNADVQFAVGSSMNGASVALSITGGLPSYLAAGASLTGSVSGDGSGASISASGSGWLYAAGTILGPVTFSFSLPGSLTWADYNDSIIALARFFVNDGLPYDQIVTAMKQFGYDSYDILNALSQIGQYGPQVESALASAFNFSTYYYDIWTQTSSGQLLVMDVSGGSQAVSAPVDTWDWNNGYNQDWAFVQSQYPGWYEIMNRGSGQCLTVEYNTSTPGNPLIQYPCGGAYNQLWYMGSVSLNTTYAIESALDGEVADVQNAYAWAGGTVDQWPYNGGQNQQFWLTNSDN